MHGNLVVGAVEGHHGRRLRARQQVADPGQGRARGVQHDVLAFPDLQHTVETLQHAVDQRLLVVAEGFLGLDDDGFAVQQGFQLDETVCAQRAARRYQVADEVCLAELGRDFDGPGEIHGLRLDAVRFKVIS